MKLKISSLLLVVAVVFGSGCIGLRGPAVVVREPSAVEESRIVYSPPPDPAFNLGIFGGHALELLSLTRPKIVKVRDRVHVAMGFDLGNVAMIETDAGLVIIDSAGSREAAARIMGEFRKLSDKPVRYLVYTHFHPDHTQGGAEIAGPGTEVIATKAFVEWIDYQNVMLGPQHRRSRMIQAGAAATEYAFKIPIERKSFGGVGVKPEVVMPGITFESTYQFELGGVKFELFATEGETEDHLAVWMPGQRRFSWGISTTRRFRTSQALCLNPARCADGPGLWTGS